VKTETSLTDSIFFHHPPLLCFAFLSPYAALAILGDNFTLIPATEILTNRSVFYFVQQFLPHNRYLVRRIRANPDLVAFDLQHIDRDPFTGGQIDNEFFAWAACEDEHGQLSFCLK